MEFFSNEQPFVFGEASYPDGGRYGPLRQEHVDISYIIEGAAVAVFDGITQTVGPGTFNFVYNAEYLEVTYPKGVRSRVMWCHTGELFSPKAFRNRISSLPLSLPSTPLMLELMHAGVALDARGGSGSASVRNSLGAAIFNEYLRCSQADAEERDLPRSVMLAKRHIDTGYAENCELEVLADVAGVTPRHLHHLFKTHLDVTPARYLWRKRSEKAVKLLQESGLSVAEIAYSCGFQTANHLARHIKQRYGLTPTDLRNRKWRRDPDEFNKWVDDIRSQDDEH